MPTDKQIFYQIVFGTKSRSNTLSESGRENMYKYIWGIFKKDTYFEFNPSGVGRSSALCSTGFTGGYSKLYPFGVRS